MPVGAAELAQARVDRGRPRLRWFVAGAVACWTLTVAASLAWNGSDEGARTLSAALHAARGAATRDVAYRRWASRMGGLYVPRDLVAPNPRLAGLPHRDLDPPGGPALTLVNPAYMVRLVYELDQPELEAKSRLVSDRPVFPGNAPDAFEVSALARLGQGAEEHGELFRGDRPVYRYLRSLRTEESCLRCHAAEGYRAGELRGAISVALPVAALVDEERHHLADNAVAHLGFWLVGLAAIAVAGRGLSRRIREREAEQVDRAHLEQELHRAQRLEALGRLSGGVAHDFNNLLTPILGHAHLLLADLPLDSPLREDLEQIALAGERAREVSRRLLTFGRRQPGGAARLSLGALAGELAPLLRRVIGADVAVRVEALGEPPPVVADRAELEVALVNLALNARDAMPDGGTLTLSTAAAELGAADAAALGLAAGPHAVLAVRDTGAGMDEATRARLFEPFFTTKDPGKGTGLGLASVRAAVQAAGGAVAVESAPGRGSTFRLYLPAAPAPTGGTPAPAAQGAPAPAPRGTERLLVVEDDEGVRRLAVAALRSLGYEVAAAPGPAAARGAAAGPGLALAVVDLAMPGATGLELWRDLAARHPGCRVLFISGHAGGAELAAAPGPILQKPFTREELGRAVRAALDAPRASGAGAGTSPTPAPGGADHGQ